MNSVLSKMVLGSFVVPRQFGQVALVSRPSDITATFFFLANRALKSREISRENTGIFAHMWHQRSLLGVNQSRPLTLNDHWQSKAIKVA